MATELKNINLTPHVQHLPLRQVLFGDFKSLGGELPIKGGWGYSIEDSIIIDKKDCTVSEILPFDGVGIEYIIVEKRIYEELIIFRGTGDKHSGIKWKLEKQKTLQIEGRIYDHLTFEVTCFRDDDFEWLKQDVQLNSSNPNFSVDHSKKREEFQCYYTTEYFFDITSFY